MDTPFDRIGSKLARIFDFARVKPLPWSIIDAHEKLREAEKEAKKKDAPEKSADSLLELSDPDIKTARVLRHPGRERP